ncbi:unnamed protein product [Rhizophagus irregularis]|nr:unnamed protein product [Rhizophagus irregularis]
MANHAPPKTEDASYQTRGKIPKKLFNSSGPVNSPKAEVNIPSNLFPRKLRQMYQTKLEHRFLERKEDPRKYYKFLTDHDRLIGEEVLRRGILESRLSTTWLNDLMKEWKKYIQNFAQD